MKSDTDHAEDRAASFTRTFDEAVQLHQSGRLEDAAAQYARVLAVDPDHADSLHLLGVIDHQQGRHEEAARQIGLALAKDPANPIYHSNLGLALRAVGRIEEAVGHLQIALKADPGYIVAAKNLAALLQELRRFEEAEQTIASILERLPRDAALWRMRGVIQLRQGQLQRAEQFLRVALDLDPNDTDTLNNLGVTLKDSRRDAEAEKILRRALTLKPGAPNLLNNLGLVLGNLRRLDEAETCYRRALQSEPDAPQPLGNLGVLLKQTQRFEEAERCFRRALRVAPDDVGTLTNLGDLLNTLGRSSESLPLLERALRLDPACAEARNNLGVTFKELGRLDESFSELQACVAANPAYTPALNNLGNELVSRGRVSEGADQFLRVLELEPDNIPALYALATSTRHKTSDAEVRRMRTLLALPKLPEGDRGLLHFALGTVLDKRGEQQAALEHAVQANQIKKADYQRRGIAFDLEWHRDFCARVRDVFSAEGFAKLASSQLASEVPIFVVGMPRSGTTLVEQIIATHPDAAGVGELNEISQLVQDLPARLKSAEPYPRCLSRLTRESAHEIANQHLEKLRHLGGNASRIVDKMTINFLHLGLIALLFPKARIVHCRRDPRDICLSCFFHNFAGPGLGFTSDLEDLGAYYREYERMMEHWKSVLPLPILDIQYEELVQDQEKWTRALLDHCHLPWDERCLAFHETERTVKTASALQVRQPIYARSIGRWKPYESGLQPLFRALGQDAAPASRPPVFDTMVPSLLLSTTPAAAASESVERQFQAALRLHQAEDLAGAQKLYRQILQLDPQHAETLHLHGVAEHSQGRHREALQLVQRAIALKPDDAAILSNLGLVFRALGQREQAAASLAQAVVLDPGYIAARRNLAVVQKELGRLDDAEKTWRELVDREPSDGANWRGLGGILYSARRLDETIAAYRRALEISPEDFDAHNNLGVACKDAGRLQESVAAHRAALRLRPERPEAHNNLGIALNALELQEEAAECFRAALRLRPNYADARHNLGAALATLNRHAEAIEEFQAAIRINASEAEFHNSLGASFQVTGRPREALACYETALRINPAHAWAHFNRSQALMLFGRYEESWQEWEWRHQRPGISRRTYPGPEWDGTPLSSGTLLLTAEQGLGDTLQFVRFALVARNIAERVVVECQEPIAPLLRLNPNLEVVARGEPLPPFDAHAPLMSLPRLLGLSTDFLSKEVAYVQADPDRVDHWASRLQKIRGLRVGISWQGNPRYPQDSARSVPLSFFAPLGEIPGVQLISLQKGHGREQLATCGFPVLDLGDEVDAGPGAFMDTAAIMKGLDLVISSDTAIPHLAGALGVPVWLALSSAPHSRWLIEGADSPWYPSMRLFRQESLGQWEAVFAEMRAALALMASGTVIPDLPAIARDLHLPVSAGEFVDRLTISEIKCERITDPEKLANLTRQLNALRAAWKVVAQPELAALTNKLKAVNERLWDIENEIRECERRSDFTERFVALARSVYRTNDERSALKREIDQLLQSPLGDEKSYAAY